jgi:hypothetical protein
VTHSERPLGSRDFLWARPAPQTASSVRIMILVGALVLYALGFVALYPPVHASVLKSELKATTRRWSGSSAPDPTSGPSHRG